MKSGRSVVLGWVVFWLALGAMGSQGCSDTVEGNETWQVVFQPNIDVSTCMSNTQWCCQNVQRARDGSFSEVWAPGQPNTARVQGTFSDTAFSATIACFGDASTSGQLTADRVDGHYAGSFSFAGSTGGLMVIPFETDTVTLQGMVTNEADGSPVAGATVTTAIDATSQAVTNQYGMFYLVTGAPKDFCCTPYRLTVSAEGFVTSEQDHVWGDMAVAQEIRLTPQ